jgi:hypothetical protein
MNITQWLHDVLTAPSRAEKIKQEKEAEAKRYAKILAEHDVFWLFEYPMRMAEIYAKIGEMNMRAEQMKAHANLQAAKENAAFHAKLFAIYQQKTNPNNECHQENN